MFLAFRQIVVTMMVFYLAIGVVIMRVVLSHGNGLEVLKSSKSIWKQANLLIMDNAGYFQAL